MCHSTTTIEVEFAYGKSLGAGIMPTDMVAALARKREAAELTRDIQTVLLGCCIVCLVVLLLISVSPSIAGAIELLGLE
jgi:hypothetical protein